jgi:hypothetical protein
MICPWKLTDFSQKQNNSRMGGGFPLDFRMGICAPENVASEAFSKCGLLPEGGI